MKKTKIKQRLEELRQELRHERISYGELTELQSLAKHIDPDDVELLEAAGVPERAEPEEMFLENNKLITEFMKTGYEFDDLKYHKSWDWLMPVVEKCYEWGELHNEYREAIVETFSGIIDHGETYKAVVAFIQNHPKTSEDTFEDTFKPIKNHFNDDAPFNGWMYETSGKELTYVFELSKTTKKVWTIIERDDDTLFYRAGFRIVNRLGFIVCENEYESGLEHVQLDD